MEPVGKQLDQHAHARYRKMLERHIDGELPALDRDELFEHLEFCEECQLTLEAEERLIDRLAQIPKLVAPSDLRAQIMAGVERERRELETPLLHDEQYASIFQAPGNGEEPVGLFAGMPASPRRRRTLVSRYSPALATGFLFAASIAAFMTTDLSAFRPLANAQKAALNGVMAVAGKASSTSKSEGGGVIASAGNASPVSPPETLTSPAPDPRPPTSDAQPPAPNHITLAQPVPKPAEKSRASLAAIVLRPTDYTADYSLDRDEFEEAIRTTAESRLNGKVESVDQFVYDGHRYRCYTVQVGDGWLEELATTLEPYRTIAEPQMLSAIEDQSRATGSAEQVAFFQGPSQVFRNAVQNSESASTERTRAVRLVVAE